MMKVVWMMNGVRCVQSLLDWLTEVQTFKTCIRAMVDTSQ